MELDIVFSGDVTGSMYALIHEMKRKIRDASERLFKEFPDVRIGVIFHGDYCDRPDIYEYLDLSYESDELSRFVQNARDKDGGDLPECYELILNKLPVLFSWRENAKKIVVMVGDNVPHESNYRENWLHLDWHKELANLQSLGIKVYGVQALGRGYATSFFKELANQTQGTYVELAQFSQIIETILAITYQQVSPERLETYGQELKASGLFNRSLATMFDDLLGKKVSRTYETHGLVPVPVGRFQELHVDKETDIKSFVLSAGIHFNKGRGFYEFTKTETIQENKEVVLMDKVSGDLFTGPEAREMIGVPLGTRDRIAPAKLEKYKVFVQSTSSNRNLKPNTMFLYEIHDYSD